MPLGQTRGKKDLEEKTTGILGMCVDYEREKVAKGEENLDSEALNKGSEVGTQKTPELR